MEMLPPPDDRLSSPPGPYTVACTYLVRPDKVEAVHELLRRHWPMLRRYGLVTEQPAVVYLGDHPAGPFFIEILTWVDPSAPGKAYWEEEINALWTDLYEFTECRNGRPGIEYPRVSLQNYFVP